MIKRNVYFEGAVQSLGAASGEGVQLTIGIVEPGEYDFGTTSRTEEIRVVLGLLYINGHSVIPDKVWVIPKGGAVKIRATHTIVQTSMLPSDPFNQFKVTLNKSGIDDKLKANQGLAGSYNG